MRHRDTQLAGPEIHYQDTQANIEALSGIASGSIAYATDTDALGFYTGSAWVWMGSGEGIISSFSVYMSSNFTPPGGTSTIMPFDTENYDTNGDFDTATYKFTAPSDGNLVIAYSSKSYNTNYNGIQVELYRSGSYIREVGARTSTSWSCTIGTDCLLLPMTSGQWAALYGWRYNGGYYLSGPANNIFEGIFLA